MCTRVGERARWEEEKTPCVQVATDAFRGIRWAGEQQVVPENHAAIEIYAEWVRKGGYTRGGSRVPSLETGGRGN